MHEKPTEERQGAAANIPDCHWNPATFKLMSSEKFERRLAFPEDVGCGEVGVE